MVLGYLKSIASTISLKTEVMLIILHLILVNEGYILGACILVFDLIGCYSYWLRLK